MNIMDNALRETNKKRKNILNQKEDKKNFREMENIKDRQKRVRTALKRVI